jgi:superfamily II DNA or RNA helicase
VSWTCVSELQLSNRHLEAIFGLETLELGRRYHLEGRVVESRVETPTTVRGRVQGLADEPYDVLVNLSPERFGVDASVECCCAGEEHCKHAAALLCHAIDDRGQNGDDRQHVDEAVQGWLEEIDTLVSEVVPLAVEQATGGEVIYVIIPDDEGGGGPAHAKTFRRTGAGQAKSYDPSDVLQNEAAVALTAMDRDLLYEMADLGYRPQHGLSLDGMLGTVLLARMLGTGRCRLGTAAGVSLHRGAERRLVLDWALDGTTCQFNVSLQTDPVSTQVLPSTPPWFVDADSGECGPVASSLPRVLSEELLGAPVIDPAHASAVVKRLARLLTPFELRVDSPPNVQELGAVVPCPVLTFTHLDKDEAWLHFAYAGHAIDPTRVTERTVVRSAEGFVVIDRALDKEQEAARTLATLGLELVDGVRPEYAGHSVWQPQSETGWPSFLIDAVPVLQDEGWRIIRDERFTLEVVEGDDWVVDARKVRNSDNFTIDLRLRGHAETDGLLAAVAQFIVDRNTAADDYRYGSQVALQVGDDVVVSAPTTRIDIIERVLTDLGVNIESLANQKMLRVPRFQSALLLELDAPQLGIRYGGDRAFADLGRRISAFNGIRELPEPPGLGVSLRPYQRQALGWLSFLADIDSGGCLADDMGLGKTIQMLAHLLAEKLAGNADRPSLVVAPTSVLGNWLREAERVAPQLRVLLLHGPRRHANFDKLANYDLCITSYALLPRDEEWLSAQPFHLVVLDEAQHIKNPRTRAAVVARKIEARRTLAMTGTPMENHLGELWALFSVLVPGLLGSEEEFRRVFRRPIERDDDVARTQALARRLAPFMLRRTKAAVAPELPPRTDIVHTVSLGASQAAAYEQVREQMELRLRQVLERGTVEDARVEILSALLRLRQVCCDPRLIGETGGIERSAKLELLMEMVPTLIEEGRHILLFSQFTSMLALIEQELNDAGITYLKLTGESRDRQSIVDRFQEGETPVFLVSLKAGGTGLNLTAADTVIHYDPWWNPAAQAQASDRAHRIGQTQPVFVHKLLSEGTVEERIFALQASKQRLADGLFLGRSESGLEWTAEQLHELLAPVG